MEWEAFFCDWRWTFECDGCDVGQWKRTTTDTFREGWVYKIGITVTDAFELEQAQLVTRHWRIKDFNGEESAVDGPGVVGFYPIVSKSMQPFAFCSCSVPLQRPILMRAYDHTEMR